MWPSKIGRPPKLSLILFWPVTLSLSLLPLTLYHISLLSSLSLSLSLTAATQPHYLAAENKVM
jgi:hypothetical protein